ncbi:hypothetical protein UFOVP231_31 [uncultured Caudovirales phage]|uniref:Uncharacterized protein n=1 Tax=uncultured Caudovirales phage TaxID=2100421 RepID=A0A6J7WPT2_9CAUD|nr:hypothetical protein UFOVP231_31 [uncultured Caudovirales phage]
MSHYAKILDGKVIQVIVAEPDFFDTFVDSSPGQWLQTSYNTRGGVHYGPDGQPDNGVALRGNYAGVGYTYDAVNDVFYAPQPFASWVLNNQTWLWDAPVPYPTDGMVYTWDEPTTSWVQSVKGE